MEGGTDSHFKIPTSDSSTHEDLDWSLSEYYWRLRRFNSRKKKKKKERLPTISKGMLFNRIDFFKMIILLSIS